MLGIIGKMFGGGVAEPIKAIGNVVDDLFTSDDERLSHKEVMERIQQRPGLVQSEINKVEAQHRSTFVAGWRPAIGWVCAASLFMFYVPQYALASYIWAKASIAADHLIPYPTTSDGLMELVFALLGMGTIRMAEKLAGRAK